MHTPKPVMRTWISSERSGVSGPREPMVGAGGEVGGGDVGRGGLSGI